MGLERRKSKIQVKVVEERERQQQIEIVEEGSEEQQVEDERKSRTSRDRQKKDVSGKKRKTK